MKDQKRASEIVKSLTLEEKASLCSGADCWHTKAIPEKGIPAIRMCDGPSGLRFQTEEDDHMGVHASAQMVSYPTGCAMASSFDRELMRQVGRAIGAESRAVGVHLVLGPAANIKRHPLCGRNFEYLSEDPCLTGEMAAAEIQGIQSQGVGACMKHYACNNQETWRMKADVKVDERTLREIYLAGFERAVKKAKPCALMASYNRVNGEAATENAHLLHEILREDWGFEGFVVSDWGASDDRAAGLLAGMDLEMPGCNGITNRMLVTAVREGKLPEAVLDRAAERIIRMGLEYSCPQKPGGDFPREEHHALAVRAASESAVLLKNQKQVLPLSTGQKVLFVGRFAEKPRFQGGGSACVTPFRMTSALEESRSYPGITYCPGFTEQGEEPNIQWEQEAVHAAASADAVVVFAGLPEAWESESYDRPHMRLPECQNRLIEAICQVQERVIVVLYTGAAVELPWLNQVQAVLQMHTGGQGVGAATVKLLYGEENPSGKLAETYPKQLKDVPSYLDFPGNGECVEYREGVFVGYRYYDTRDMEVNFPFGHGLSYTEFAYENMRVSQERFGEREILKVQVDIRNTGSCYGREAVQLYVEDHTDDGNEAWKGNEKSKVYVREQEGRDRRPVRELKGFEKVGLAPGEQTTVSFFLDSRDFSWFQSQCHRWSCQAGRYRIQIGASSRDLRLYQDVTLLKNEEKQAGKVTMRTLMSELASDKKRWQETLRYLAEANPKLDEIINGTTDTACYLKEEMKELPLYAVRGLYGVEQEHMEKLLDRLNQKGQDAEQLWENYPAQLMVEYEQCRDEGLEIEAYRGLMEGVAGLPESREKTQLAHTIWSLLQKVPVKKEYPWKEPSEYDKIQELCQGNPWVPVPDRDTLYERVKGAWYGRICGCLLGKPIECFLTEELQALLQGTGNWPMHTYIRQADITEELERQFEFDVRNRCYADTVPCAPADDDTNYVVLAGDLIEQYGKEFTTKDVAELWLRALPKDVYCTAERVAYLNAGRGICPPRTAVYQNPYRELIGAQIRGDYFGYINPGRPKAAAKMAYRDAAFTHVKNGIYGEMFAAAMLSWAAVTDDMEEILMAGLHEIPKTSRLYDSVNQVISWWKEQKTYQEVIGEIAKEWDEKNPYQWGHTIPNAMIVAAVLLYGGGDYSASICLAVQTGFDTDCNGATVGSVIGMAKGIQAIGAEWLEPVHGKLQTDIFGKSCVEIQEMVERTMRHMDV